MCYMRDKGLNGGNADYDVAVVAIMLVKLGGIDDTDACGVGDDADYDAYAVEDYGDAADAADDYDAGCDADYDADYAADACDNADVDDDADDDDDDDADDADDAADDAGDDADAAGDYDHAYYCDVG